MSADYATHVATLSRHQEPTTTATLRDRYEADLYKRFRRVKGLLRETVAEHDALRLTNTSTLAVARRDFEFDDDAAKEAAFMEWLRGALDDEVLEPIPQTEVIAGSHYTAQYIRASSQKGAEYAARQLRKEGIEITEEEIARSFRQGAHRDKLRTLYRRNYAALDGITDELDRQISRELSEGVGRGESPRTMARTLNERADKIGITRARTLARTEIMNAHHTHTQVRYEEAGVEEFDVIPFEPCELCQDLVANNPHPVSEITSLLPRHPRCVCAPVPRV